MELQEFSRLLGAGCAQNGVVEPAEEQIKQFFDFTTRLVEVNAKMNLTAIREIPDIITKHYVDCLLALPYLESPKKVLDVGCGGGFPTVPLAIMRPNSRFVALDSTEKKVRFVEGASREIGLSNVSVVVGRAEELSVRERIGKVDRVVSRAVADLAVLVELCLPYLTAGGKMIALKGQKGDEELARAQKAVEILGGKAELVEKQLILPDGSAESRKIILIQKVKETPTNYPRRYSEIVKKPL